MPLPSGVATNSPWVDITHSSPPWQGEDPCPWDYLAKPATLARAKRVESPSWPADPPRRNIYAEDGLERHPLVSPINAPSWRGCPPVWICTGWEMIGHEDRCLAHRLNRDGVPVVFEEYEAMPHCFAMLLSWTAVSRRCIDGWASFIRRAVEEPVSLVGAAAVEIKASSLEEVPMSIEDLRDPNDDEIWYTEQTASKL